MIKQYKTADAHGKPVTLALDEGGYGLYLWTLGFINNANTCIEQLQEQVAELQEQIADLQLGTNKHHEKIQEHIDDIANIHDMQKVYMDVAMKTRDKYQEMGEWWVKEFEPELVDMVKGAIDITLTKFQQQSQAQAVTVHNQISIGEDMKAIIQAMLQQAQYRHPPMIDTKPVKGVSTRGVQTHSKTQATPASKASKRCVSYTPDTLADTPAFRQCVEDGVSRTDLAKRFGVSESTIARAKRKL